MKQTEPKSLSAISNIEKECEWWNQIYDNFLRETDDRMQYSTIGSWGAWRLQLESLIRNLRKLRRLKEVCRDFIEKQRIGCPEDVYQTDRVIENAYGFIETICEEVGYYTPTESE